MERLTLVFKSILILATAVYNYANFVPNFQDYMSVAGEEVTQVESEETTSCCEKPESVETKAVQVHTSEACETAPTGTAENTSPIFLFKKMDSRMQL